MNALALIVIVLPGWVELTVPVPIECGVGMSIATQRLEDAGIEPILIRCDYTSAPARSPRPVARPDGLRREP